MGHSDKTVANRYGTKDGIGPEAVGLPWIIVTQKRTFI